MPGGQPTSRQEVVSMSAKIPIEAQQEKQSTKSNT